ncbi:MAG TPA: hypothetical protein VE935_11855, partial [Burkholderiales bacterium]|nr:hypothetical protein [Burkholderiales bacterium]
MTVSIARPAAARGPGLGLAIAGLAMLALLAGAGIALGELQAMYGVLSLVAAAAVIADFRFGAVLVIVMLPIEASVYFPHSLFGVTGVNPLNLVLAATLASFLLRGKDLGRFLPKPLLFFVVLPMLFAGLLGTRHVHEIHPAYYESMLINFNTPFGYFRDVALKPL